MSDEWNDDAWDVQFGDQDAQFAHSQNKEVESRVSSNIGFERGAGDESEESTNETILVCKKSVGKIIGRGGSKVRELSDISGARINISRDCEGDNVPIAIFGPKQAIKTARMLIEELEHSCSSTYQQNGSRGNFGNDYSTVKTIQVEATQCGRIIGRGGSKISALQEESGARIEINKNQTEDDMTPVTIKGDEKCVTEAEKLIKELLEEQSFYRKEAKHCETKTNPIDDLVIDWAGMNTICKKQQTERWAKLKPIRKNFYIEDNAVADMLPFEVEEWREQNFNIAVTHLAEKNPQKVLNPVLTFEHAFKHYPEILDTIYAQNFKTPSPIQSQAWPLAMRGFDVIGIAQTGTGKTLAFLLPVFIHIDGQTIPVAERNGPSCLILTPTRELALQIEMEIKKYHYRDIRCVCVYGGGDRRSQINLVKRGVEIIVATPGRFNDLIANGFVSLESVSFLVLDEADRMLDMGFEPQIMKILLDIRPDRQSMMTSATWPKGVRRLATSYLTDPMQITVGSLDLAAVHTVTQSVEVIAQEEKLGRMFDFIDSMEGDDKVLIFVGRKVTADYLATELVMRNILCQSIHGDREQYDREQALSDFKTGVVRILVATDVASRGLDVADVTHVFNYDYPRNTEEYVHRVGRTGRAGKSGHSITLVTTDDWSTAKELIEILAKANQNVPIELQAMAERFARMKERREREGGGRGRRGRGGGGGFRSRNGRW